MGYIDLKHIDVMQIVKHYDVDTIEDNNNEFRKTLEYIRILKQRYKEMYDESPDLLRTINTDGIIHNCNKSYAKNLGYSKNELIGTSIFDTVSKESMNSLYDSFNTWKETGHVENKLVWLKRKDDSTFPVLISANNLYDENDILIGSNSSLRDVSELHYNKKKIMELENKDRQKEKFSLMITHDLKALVNPVKGYCDMLHDPKIFGPLNSQQLDAINEISQNVKKLERLISDIHDVQKIDMQQITLIKRSINVKDMLKMVCSAFTPLFIEKKIKIQCEIPDKELFIHGDVDRVFQIFLNLIRNASDFVPKNNGAIKIGSLTQSQFIIFYVQDNGIGIATEKQEKLFHEFYQVDVIRGDQHIGSGLGLAICKGLTKKMGGRIWVESKEGSGTTIYFSMPRETKK